jgi:hypothetical protein
MNRPALSAATGFAVALACIAALSLPTRASAAPSSTLPPRADGFFAAGETLVADPGSWSGSGAVSTSFQWQSCDAPLYFEDVLDDGPLDLWRLDDTDPATLADQTGNAASGSYGAGVTLGVPGEAGATDAAARFDGTAAAIATAPVSASLQGDFTVEGWVKRSAGHSPVELVGQPAAATGTGWQVVIGADDKLRLVVPGLGTVAGAATPVPADGAFHQFGVVAARAGAQVFLDGKDATAAARSIPVVADGNDVELGGAYADPAAPGITAHLNGVLDDVSVAPGAQASNLYWHYKARNGACHDIPGATASTYQLGAADLARHIRVVVTATDGTGSTSAASPFPYTAECETESDPTAFTPFCSVPGVPAGTRTANLPDAGGSTALDCGDAPVCEGTIADLQAAGFDTTGLEDPSERPTPGPASPDAPATGTTGTAWLDFWLRPTNCDGTVRDNGNCGWLYHHWSATGGTDLVTAYPARAGDDNPAHKWIVNTGPLPDNIPQGHYTWGFMNGHYTGFESTDWDAMAPGGWRLDPWSVTRNGVTRGAFLIHGGIDTHEFHVSRTHGCIRLTPANIESLKSLWSGRTPNRTTGAPLYIHYS